MDEVKKLSGKWLFELDFGVGVDSGYIYISEKNDKLIARSTFLEQIGGESTFIATQLFKCFSNGDSIRLEGESCEILYASEDITYELDTWIGVWIDDHTIKGKSFDEDDVCGIFMMQKCSL